MIRLEIQLSTFSLVAFSATIFPLATSGLTFYLAACTLQSISSAENNTSIESVKVPAASAITGVFLLLMALAQICTGLMCVPLTQRTLLLAMHTFPLLSAVVAGIVWFGSQLSGKNPAKQHVETELAALILWFMSTVSCTMASTYFITKTQLLIHGDASRGNLCVCYDPKEAADQTSLPRPLTPPLCEKKTFFASPTFSTSTCADRNYRALNSPEVNRFSTALTLKDESSDLYIPAGPGSKTTLPIAAQIKPMTRTINGSPLRNSEKITIVETDDTTAAGFAGMIGKKPCEHSRFDTLRPSFRVHHECVNAVNSFYSPDHSRKDSMGTRESLVAPLVFPKQRALSKEIKGLITSGARSLSNGTSRISTKLLQQSSLPIRDTSKSWRTSKKDLPQLHLRTNFFEKPTNIHQQEQHHQDRGFYDWDVNSTRLKDRLLISSLSNFDIKSAFTESRPVSAIATAGGGAQRKKSHSSSLNEAGFTPSATPQIGPLDEHKDNLLDLSDISDEDVDDNDLRFIGSGKRRHSYVCPHFEKPPPLISNSGTRIIHKLQPSISATAVSDEILPTPASMCSAFSFADSVLFVNGAH